jgi:hypothetical protein
MNGVQISDVIDLTWMAAGTLELRSVQELLERLSAAVLPRNLDPVPQLRRAALPLSVATAI